MNLKIKEFNCEKAGFRVIHTENDADMFILNETAKTKSVGYLPVRVIYWNFFLAIAKIDWCGNAFWKFLFIWWQ